MAISPVSESVMLVDRNAASSRSGGGGLGLVGTYSPFTRRAFHELAEREYASQDYRIDELPANPSRFAGGLYVVLPDKPGTFRMAVTAGILVAGLDATARLSGSNFVTIGFFVPGDFQFFLQRPLYSRPDIGVGVGIGYHRTTFSFSPPSEAWFNFEYTATGSWGVRSFVVLRSPGDDSGGIKLGAYAGYLPSLGSGIVTLTFAVGRL